MRRKLEFHKCIIWIMETVVELILRMTRPNEEIQ
jgi:hypothetical protein